MGKLWFWTERAVSVRLIFVVAVLVLSFASVSFSGEYKAWPGEFLRMGAGARAMGMGNAYSAVEGDVYSSYFNPAGLAAMENRQLALSIRYLSMDRKFVYFGFGNRIGPDADFSISWLRSGTDGISGRDLNGNITNSLEDERNAVSMTFSKSINKMLSIGVNTKLILWKLASEDARTFGFDIGAIVRPINKLSVSFVLRDIKSRFRWESQRWKKNISGSDSQPLEKEDSFPVYYSIGVAYKTYMDKLLFSASFENVEDNPAGLNLGTSYEIHDRLTLRTGLYNYTFSDEFETGSVTFGFTLNVTRTLGFDYAYVPDDFGNDSVHVVAFLMNYGER
ncbi:PorV/PorQ family protein [Candidatus Latescibacterota bacterium]